MLESMVSATLNTTCSFSTAVELTVRQQLTELYFIWSIYFKKPVCFFLPLLIYFLFYKQIIKEFGHPCICLNFRPSHPYTVHFMIHSRALVVLCHPHFITEFLRLGVRSLMVPLGIVGQFYFGVGTNQYQSFHGQDKNWCWVIPQIYWWLFDTTWHQMGRGDSLHQSHRAAVTFIGRVIGIHRWGWELRAARAALR